MDMRTPTPYSLYKKGRARKNILHTMRVWGVSKPEALITYVDYEVQKFLAQITKERK